MLILALQTGNVKLADALAKNKALEVDIAFGVQSHSYHTVPGANRDAQAAAFCLQRVECLLLSLVVMRG